MTTAQPPDGPPEVDWAWTNDDSAVWIPPEINPDRPSPARMYDYALGGKDNFEVDREAVEAVGEILPEFREAARANRGFLVRAVDTMAGRGIDQFIDLGTGIPTAPNVHEIAQQIRPDARVVYIDNDPIVMTHNRALLSRRPGVITVLRDLREPASILTDPLVRAHLDFDRPIGLLLVAVLHFVSRDLGVKVVSQYRRSLPAGSCIGISTACRDGMQPELINRLEQVYSKSAAPVVLRTVGEIEQLFEGVDLIEPGLTDVTQWGKNEAPLPVRNLCGVGKITTVGR